MDPWGTPQEILRRAEDLPLNSTYCDLFEKQFFIQSSARPRIGHNVRVCQKGWHDQPCQRLLKGQGKDR